MGGVFPPKPSVINGSGELHYPLQCSLNLTFHLCPFLLMVDTGTSVDITTLRSSRVIGGRKSEEEPFSQSVLDTSPTGALEVPHHLDMTRFHPKPSIPLNDVSKGRRPSYRRTTGDATRDLDGHVNMVVTRKVTDEDQLLTRTVP